MKKYTLEQKAEAQFKKKEYKRQYFQRNKVKIREKRRQNPLPKERIQNYQLKYHYGISKDEYDALYIVQKGKCGICNVFLDEKTNKTHSCLDHNHKNGHIRLLLCRRCNSGIGLFDENPECLKNAARYLEE